jgi:hypothetical protein
VVSQWLTTWAMALPTKTTLLIVTAVRTADLIQ